MKIIKPLQLNVQTQSFMYNKQNYLVVSATLGVNSQNDVLLSTDFVKDAFECMGDNLTPDLGMPKPHAEFLVSGNFYSKAKNGTEAGFVKVIVGDKEKQLSIFGDRTWIIHN